MFTFMLLWLAVSSPDISAPVAPKEIDNAWDLLTSGIADKRPDKRAKAIHALGLIPGSSKARTLAEKALKDDNRDVRVEAATSLGEMDALSSRPALKQALNDKEVAVVLAATNALYQMKDPVAYEVYFAVLTGERKSSSGLIESQLSILHDRKQLEKIAFETGIGFVPFGSIGYEAWRTITRDESSAIRAVAAERLAKDPDPKSAGALISSCTDKKWQVRAAVVKAIAERGDKSLAYPLVPLLQDSEDTVRFFAAATIIRLSTLPQTKPGRHPVRVTPRL